MTNQRSDSFIGGKADMIGGVDSATEAHTPLRSNDGLRQDGAKRVTMNIKDARPSYRRGAAECDRPLSGSRAARGGARRCRPAGHGMTAAVVRRDETSALVAVAGEIDVRTAQELRTVLVDLANEGRVHLVADFAAVRFCDAAGLGALVAVRNRLRECGGTLRLTGVRPAQRRILRVTGLDGVFEPSDGAGEKTVF